MKDIIVMPPRRRPPSTSWRESPSDDGLDLPAALRQVRP
jgi:hypothetical protein